MQEQSDREAREISVESAFLEILHKSQKIDGNIIFYKLYTFEILLLEAIIFMVFIFLYYF
jgi:hypothetical protein